MRCGAYDALDLFVGDGPIHLSTEREGRLSVYIHTFIPYVAEDSDPPPHAPPRLVQPVWVLRGEVPAAPTGEG